MKEVCQISFVKITVLSRVVQEDNSSLIFCICEYGAKNDGYCSIKSGAK